MTPVPAQDWISGEHFLKASQKKQGKRLAARNLKYYRRAAKMTQAKLAKAVGSQFRHHISEMESGKRPIEKAMARKIAKALGVKKIWLSFLTDI